MADSPASGVQLAQQSRNDHAIERVATGVVAFVGRTLKGPVNQPGRRAQLRRVPAALRRPVAALHTFLRGRAVLREWRPRGAHRARRQRCAAADADAARRGGDPALDVPSTPARASTCAPRSTTTDSTAAEHERFNLVVQRVRTAGSELVEDQEIYRRVSIAPASGRFVTDVLLESRLVRLCGACPRSARTALPAAPVGSPPATPSPIPTAMTARRSPTTTSSAPRARHADCSRWMARGASTSCAFRR